MIEIKEKINLAPYTSWLVGGPAEFLALPKSLDEIKEAQEWAQKRNLKVTVLGGGSNVLIADQGIPGLVLVLKNFNGTQVMEEQGQLKITALSGSSKSELLKIFLKAKLAPALFLAGLPGDVGGGVVMNAGVGESFKPREFVEITDWVEVLKPDGKIQKYSQSEIQWTYRHSNGWQPGIITAVGLKWPVQPDPTILDQVKQANKTRLSKQPLDMPSCGSVFVNPQGHKAAQLIDSSHLKGFTIGGAQVSQKHANFIVNLGNATASDILQVIEHVQKTVLALKGVQLQTEVVRLGF
ncbi:MAG: UDP-N-acetylmuramate dehydrogenase [Pseudobdellovibrionaceae bacterium]